MRTKVQMSIERGQEEAPLSLKELAQAQVLSVLAQVGGNKSEAARVLGIDRRTLYRQLRRIGEYEPPVMCLTCGAERG